MKMKLLKEALPEGASGADAAILVLLALFFFSVPFSIFLAQIGCFGALIVWAGMMVRRRRFDPERTGFEVFFGLYFLAELIATLFSYNKGQSLLYMQRRMMLILILYVIVSNVRTEKSVRALLASLLLSAVLVSLWGFRDLLFHLADYLAFERRLSEFQMYMTAGGIMMIVALLILPFLFHRGTPREVRWTLAIVMIPVLVNLLFTFTRSSWLGLIAGAIVIGIRRQRQALMLLLVAVVLVVAVSSPEIRGRMTSIFDVTHSNNLTRVNMWKTGWRMFLDHPLIGIGDMGTEQLWDRYSEPGWTPEGHLHNNLLMWLVTMGLAGFLVLVSLFVAIWMRLWKLEAQLKDDWLFGSLLLGGLGVLAGFHINGLFEWNFGDAEIMMLIWGITGLSLAAGRIAGAKG